MPYINLEEEDVAANMRSVAVLTQGARPLLAIMSRANSSVFS